MINPIGATSSYSQNGLEPVKVPHFCGKTRITISGSKLEAPAAETKKRHFDTVAFKQQVDEVAQATKKGAAKTYAVAKNTAKKGFEFTTAFVRSLAKDTVDIARTRGAKHIARIDNVGDNIVNLVG